MTPGGPRTGSSVRIEEADEDEPVGLSPDKLLARRAALRSMIRGASNDAMQQRNCSTAARITRRMSATSSTMSPADEEAVEDADVHGGSVSEQGS